MVLISGLATGPSKAKDSVRICSSLAPQEATTPQVRNELDLQGGLWYLHPPVHLADLQSCQQTTFHQHWNHIYASLLQQLGVWNEEVNKDSKGNSWPTVFLVWAKNWSENLCHKEKQPQGCFKLHKLPHQQTVRVRWCLDSPSPVTPFTQTYFGRFP